jgi:hypothetical protein
MINVSTDSSKTSKPNKTKLLVITGATASLAVIATLVGVIIYLTTRPEAPLPPPPSTALGGRGTVITEDNVEEFQDLGEPVEDGYYEARMSVEWDFDTWDTPSTNAYVANAESNTRNMYFDVIINSTGEQIFSSPYIPVGSALRNFALDTQLAAGTYEATVVYHLVDDNNEEVTTVSVAVTIKIRA